MQGNTSLWGKIRRAVEASEDSAQASAADLAATRLSLQAQLAQAYFALRVTDRGKRLLDNTVAGVTATGSFSARGIEVEGDNGSVAGNRVSGVLGNSSTQVTGIFAGQHC